MPHPDWPVRGGIAAFPKTVLTNERHENANYISEISRRLKARDMPVPVWLSDKDIAFHPYAGRNIAHIVPNGRFHLVENAGHYLQEDSVEEIAR